MSTWQFDPLAYQVGWRSFGVDRPHYPFQFRPSSATADEYDSECLAAARRFRNMLDDDLYWAFVTMLSPEARVYACGFAGAGDAAKVRIYAAVRGAHAVVVSQEPGPDHRCGGTVRVTRLPHRNCGQAVLQALPAIGAGSHSRIDVDRLSLETEAEDDFDTPASWLRSSAPNTTPKQDFESLLSRPRVGVGRVEVYAGPTIAQRDTGGARDLRWVDIADDGRYLVAQGPRTVSVLPGTADVFEAQIQKLVTAAVEENRSELAV